MNLKEKKRLAAAILKVGVSRVRFDPESSEDIQDAITRSSMRGLIIQGAVWAAPEKGVSRGRYRVRAEKRRRRGRGAGSKKGKKTARMGKKRLWINHVRTLRKRLKMLRDRGEISKDAFHVLYSRVKGGQVRNLKHLVELQKEIGRRPGA